MNTNKQKLAFKIKGLIRFGLKGQCIFAQPSGLGSKDTPNISALKGHSKGRLYVALSERFVKWK